MQKFDLNEQWKTYLQRVGLQEDKLHPVQLTETKRAFFGACGQLLILLRDDLSVFPEDTAVEIMQDMIRQVADFWNSQLK